MKLWEQMTAPGLFVECTVIFQCDNYSGLLKIIWTVVQWEARVLETEWWVRKDIKKCKQLTTDWMFVPKHENFDTSICWGFYMVFWYSHPLWSGNHKDKNHLDSGSDSWHGGWVAQTWDDFIQRSPVPSPRQHCVVPAGIHFHRVWHPFIHGRLGTLHISHILYITGNILHDE